MENKIRALLFDFDGVLADTMNDNFLAWKMAFLDFGIEIKKEDYFVLEGLKLVNIAKTLGKNHNFNEEDFEKIVILKNRYYLENPKLIFYPLIHEIIDNLKNKKLAIVSASPREKIEKTVPKEFLDKFDAVICSEDYENGKPDPEPYLTAMQKLNLKPEECIVIENAPFGIKAAKSAGAYCIALMTTLDKDYLREADVILENHDELSKFLNQKNLQKVPDPLLKNEVCSELFLHSKFLGSSKRLHSSPFSKMESSGFDDNKFNMIEN